MKILIIPTSYPDEINPTRNIFIYEQAVALSKAGHEIRILHAQKQPSKDLITKIDKKIKIHDEGYAIRYSLPVKTFLEDKFIESNKKIFIKAISELFYFATLDGWIPDVIYAHFSCWAGYAAISIGKNSNIPVAVIEHFSGFMNEHPPRKMVEGLKYVSDNADAMISVSDNLRDSIISKTSTSRSIFVVPNMIDPSFRYVEHPVKENFVFSAVCNLNERKRVKELVKAFCKAFKKDESVELIIGGDGPEKNAIIDYINKNNRNNQITLLGRLDRQETVELCNKSNCFALVSAHETFGIVWREAMATGLPVITSNHEGWSNKDWSDDFGIMVPVDDEEKLIAALREIKEKYSTYNGLKISDYCNAHYSEKAVVSQLEEIFSLIC